MVACFRDYLGCYSALILWHLLLYLAECHGLTCFSFTGSSSPTNQIRLPSLEKPRNFA